jgi:TnpA family transposase
MQNVFSITKYSNHLELKSQSRGSLSKFMAAVSSAPGRPSAWKRAAPDEPTRPAPTIRAGQVRPSTLLAKLSAFPRQNVLALALRDIGRINRSIFLPQWWKNTQMRRNAAAGLNKSEAQNTLARALFFNRLGELRDRTFDSQFYRGSGPNLLINAIVYWNTLYLEPAFAQIQREGAAMRPDLLRHITPLGWQHISLTGDYV